MENSDIMYELHVPAPKWKPCVVPERAEEAGGDA